MLTSCSLSVTCACVQFIIDEVFGVPGVGTVVAGEHTALASDQTQTQLLAWLVVVHAGRLSMHVSACVRRATLAQLLMHGCCAAGTVKRGVITPNCNLLLGPDIGDASFKTASIKSIVSVGGLETHATDAACTSLYIA